MGNVYDSADRTDRTYARGGQLREDRRWRYHYDKQGNLVLKTKRKISPCAETPQDNRKSVFGLFSSSNTSKEKGREDGALTWQPGDYAYTWLPNGMLGSVTRPDGKVVTFKYDALGRRIEKSFNGRVHRYLWDGDVVLHEWEYDETERPQQIVAENGDVSFDRSEPTDTLVTWVYGTDSYVPTAKLVGGKRYGIVSDYIGRPVQAYDEHGTPVWQADYDIYGNLLNLKGDSQFVPFRQLGQYEDEETGLYYNRFRYYDPNTGGYISQDPIGLAGENPTLYGYVTDSNLYTDEFGLYETIIFPQDKVIKEVTIHMQGSRSQDFKVANKEAGILGKRKKATIGAHKTTYGDVTWHHASYNPKDNTAVMQLVKRADHEATLPHEGAVKQFESKTGYKYESQVAINEARKLNGEETVNKKASTSKKINPCL